MDKLTFKTFSWPVNPETYREELQREAVYTKTEEGTIFSGMGPAKRVITGEGVFFGTGAYETFRTLAELFADGTVGTMSHPVLGNRQVFFTRLNMTQNPTADSVGYSFEFQETDAEGEIPQ